MPEDQTQEKRVEVDLSILNCLTLSIHKCSVVHLRRDGPLTGGCIDKRELTADAWPWRHKANRHRELFSR